MFHLNSILLLSLWDMIKNKRKTVNLCIIKDQKFKMIRDGDIAKILFSEQHLIPFKKSFEYSSLDLFFNSIHPGDVVLDIGANVGVYSLLASKKIGAQGKIYAFEPTAATFELLTKNLTLNHCENVVPVKKALSDSKQRILMKVPEKWERKDTDAFNKMVFVSDQEGGEDVMMTETLDDFFISENIQRVDFIKVDIEGAEYLFFKGAKNVLSKHKPRILFESNEMHCKSFQNSVIDVLVYLNNLGYKLEQINQDQWFAK